ncbi:MAG: glycosyltransferase [Betaproteobacteria bacterium]
MAAPLVSVVVRSSARASLAAALQCIGAQTYPSLEAVVVAASGASHPPVPATVGPHAVRFVASDTPLSRPAAANAGLDAARGDWITFLDDDDLIDPTHVDGLAAVAQKSRHKVVCALARVRLADGSRQNWGQPFALTELYLRNFLHLSTVLFSRAMPAAGCRFDVEFEIMQDWDFFLQMAQHTVFQSTGLRTFEWHADAGTSGTGGDVNSDSERFARFRDRIYAKWRPARDALAARVEPLLAGAANDIAAANWQRAEARCEEALKIARNEPDALDMLAMLMHRSGRGEEGVAIQSLAATIRPYEPSYVFHLARMLLDRGERDRALRLAREALRLAPDYAPAAQFLAALAP